MQLRLNPAHPLCNRNLVFATYGTGYGSRVLNLATSTNHPSKGPHGDMHSGPNPRAIRTMSSVLPPGAPSDTTVLALRDSVNAVSAVRFDPYSAIVLVDNFTVAIWVRPWQLTTYQVPIGTSVDGIGGWNLYCSTDASTSYKWQVYFYDGTTAANIVVDDVATLGAWNLLVFTRQSSASPQHRFYRNGDLKSVVGTPGAIGLTSNAYGALWLGGHDGWAGLFQNQCDIAAAFVWGSVLSAEEVALLYRDTWGMVTRPRRRLMPEAQSSSTNKLLARRFNKGMFSTWQT